MRYIFISILSFNVSYLIAKDSASDCSKIKSDTERLACYDNTVSYTHLRAHETQ